jgi:regulatory protein
MDRKITDIKQQKNNPNRVNIYLDGEFAFGIARIVAAWLQVGQILDETKIETLQQQDTKEVAFQKALRFISYRPRTESEVRKKLESQGFSESVVGETVERLISGQLIEDERFARSWIDDRSTFHPRSRRVLTLELRKKGVAEETISTALADATSEDELAYQAAKHRIRRFQNLEYREFREKLSGYLARRGFNYGTIAPVVQKVWHELHSAQSDGLDENEGDIYDMG